MNRWKKKYGDVHLMNGNITLCNIAMLGNNYAEKDENITCTKCKMFIDLIIIKKSSDKSVTSYSAALYKAAVIKLSDLSDKELENFIEFNPLL